MTGTDLAFSDSRMPMNDDRVSRDSTSLGETTGVPEPFDGIRDDPIPDTRLYVPDNEDWNVHIKRDSERIYCYSKLPGHDWFHLILSGEIYVARQHERYCLHCALRMGFVTHDRLFWQHRVPKKPTPTL